MSNLDKRAPIGVGIIVFNDEGDILLGKRKGAHEAGTWALPGGKPDAGEHPQAAAWRELLEETGLDAVGLRPLGFWTYDRFEDDSLHYVTLYFVAELTRGELSLREPDKCEGWEWCDPSNLPAPLFKGAQEAIDYELEMWL